ncbi:MAG: hypothetical protein Q9226_009345, partial [Calogaya cf. arnoldii]
GGVKLRIKISCQISTYKHTLSGHLRCWTPVNIATSQSFAMARNFLSTAQSFAPRQVFSLRLVIATSKSVADPDQNLPQALTTFQEAHKAKIDISDDDLPSLQRMLKFLYTTGYNDEDEPLGNKGEATRSGKTEHNALSRDHQKPVSTTPSSNPREAEKGDKDDAQTKKIDATTRLNNVLVYALADKYDIPLLKDLAKCR